MIFVLKYDSLDSSFIVDLFWKMVCYVRSIIASDPLNLANLVFLT